MRFWNRLAVRLLGSVAAVALAMSLASFGWDAYRQQRQAEVTLTERARAVTKQFLAVRSFVAQTETQRVTTTGQEFHHLDPLAVARVVGEIFGSGAAAHVREVWDGSAVPVHQPDAVERDAIARFAASHDVQEWWQLIGDGGNGEGRVFRYVAPIYLEQSCMSCHAQNRLLPLAGGQPPQVGQVMGALSIEVPIRAFEAGVASSIRSRLQFTALLTLLSLVVLAVLLRRLVTVPVGHLTQRASRLATGDLSPAPLPPGAAGEVGLLASVMESMAASLRELYTSLEAKVEERTRRLTEVNAQLRRQQEELRRAQQLQSEFLATISHELRTPLTSILAFTELLLEDDGARGDWPTQREYLADIRESAQRLYGQINDLLDLARIEAGLMTVQSQELPLDTVIQRALLRIGPLATKKGLTLAGPPAGQGENLRVWADPARTEQVLMNLLSNAVKFTPAGGRVWVEVAPGTREVTVSVCDTGIGIRPEHQAIIFEKFRQVDSSASREYPGSGLGLTLARHLVEKQGGRIGVHSQPAKGSTFFFTLPVAPVRLKAGGEDGRGG